MDQRHHEHKGAISCFYDCWRRVMAARLHVWHSKPFTWQKFQILIEYHQICLMQNTFFWAWLVYQLESLIEAQREAPAWQGACNHSSQQHILVSEVGVLKQLVVLPYGAVWCFLANCSVHFKLWGYGLTSTDSQLKNVHIKNSLTQQAFFNAHRNTKILNARLTSKQTSHRWSSMPLRRNWLTCCTWH